MKINPNDPRLTAYALGEMDKDESLKFEQEMQNDPEVLRSIAEISELAGILTQELSKEPLPSLTEQQKSHIQTKVGPAMSGKSPGWWGGMFTLPRLAGAMALLALIAGVLMIAQPNYLKVRPQTELARSNQPVGNLGDELSIMNQSDEVKEAKAIASVPLKESESPGESLGFSPLATQPPLDTVSRLHQAVDIASQTNLKVAKGVEPSVEVAAKPEIPAALEPLLPPSPAGQPVPAKPLPVSSNTVVSQQTDLLITAQGGAPFFSGGHSATTQPIDMDGDRARGTIAAGDSSALVTAGRQQDRGETLNRPLKESLEVLSADKSKSAELTAGSGPASSPLVAGSSLRPNQTLHLGTTLERRSERLASAATNPSEQKDEAVNSFYYQEEAQGAQESYAGVIDNPFRHAQEEPLSTFSIDVDTASYSNVRRYLNQGSLPPAEAVRIEELLNYFPYDYKPPSGTDPFAVHIEWSDCPWASGHRLVRIALKGRVIPEAQRPDANLVFLVDVSGSMQPENKLPLLRKGLLLLLGQLKETDRVAIVTYAGSSGLALPSTACSDKAAIRAAIDNLQSGGSTNGAAGIQLAYKTAQDNFIKDGINRVILATDGDFNVGVTSQEELTNLITEKAKSGVFLSVLGFGMGNLKDATLENLADKGNGNYAYIDTLQEARKVLVEQIAGTLITIAKDVKIQVEFNPGIVSAYRLIGYENRILAAQDFNDDRKDAGEIGAGHTLTVLYEIVPVGVAVNVAGVDPLKYQVSPASKPVEVVSSPESFNLKLRYKQPTEDNSHLLEIPAIDSKTGWENTSVDFRFAASVATFGMSLRQSPYRGGATMDMALNLAQQGKGEDRDGYRAEFIQLIGLAKALKPN